MMTARRQASRIHSLFLTTTRFLHLSRTSLKKQYNYDLNNLLKWKNETAQFFGPVRKPTKTGKLKKTKKCLEPQIEENLQTLSALSNNSENSLNTSSPTPAINTRSKKFSPNKANVFDDTLLPYLPSYFVNANVQEDNYIMENFDDIPDDVLISSLIPHKAEYEQRSTFDDDVMKCEESLYKSRESEYNIVIQKMSPIPTITDLTSAQKYLSSRPLSNVVTSTACENIRKQATNHSSKSVKTMRSEDVLPKNNTSTIVSASPILAKPKNTKNSKVTSKNSSSKTKCENNSSDVETDNNLKQESTKTEVFIPKMKPIPLGTTSYASTFSQQQTGTPSVPLLKSPVLKAVQNLPFEPPESFAIIPKIPLFPMESNDWQRKLDSDIFHAFKLDVEQMSLRVPPSVKSILNKTMPDLNRFFLNRWREGLIKELGEEGFQKQQDATIRNGVNLHANIMECLSGKPISELQIMPENEGHWCSLQSGLAAVSGVKALEMNISHSMLFYRGVFDCLAQYKDMLCMIDWKTSKKPRPLLKNTYDDPVQIAAYIGALNSSDTYVEKLRSSVLSNNIPSMAVIALPPDRPVMDMNYGQVSHGVIVVAYPDGSPAHVHVMNKSVSEQHWRDWTERLYNYYQLIYTEKMAVNADRINAKSQA